MVKDYSVISGTYAEVVPEEIKTDLNARDKILEDLLLQAPCNYHPVTTAVFNLVDSEENDLYESNVRKEVTIFGGTDRVLFSYRKDKEGLAYVISGNSIDGYCVFQLNG